LFLKLNKSVLFFIHCVEKEESPTITKYNIWCRFEEMQGLRETNRHVLP